jgi:hypothetical protein
MEAQQRCEVIAAACHSAWYAYTVLALGEAGAPWDTAPGWQRASIRDAVAFWDLASHGCTVAELRKTLPAQSHVFRTVDPAIKKTHHCMVPYADLPEEQKAKDTVVVEAYIAIRQALGEL